METVENKKKVIFIGGSSHSGSTMLDLMLSTHPECFSAGEVQSLFRPSKPHHINPICGCGVRGCGVWQDIYVKGEKNLYENIFSKYPKIDTIVDSSKSLSWFYDQSRFLSGKGIKIYYFVIWKKPLEFAVSLYKRDKIEKFDKAWTNYYKNYFDIIPRPVAVKYKELAQNPATTIQVLMKIIGKKSIPDQHLYWQKKHHTLFGSAASRIHLHDIDTSEYERLVGHIKKNEQKKKVDEKAPFESYRKINYSNPNVLNLPSVIQGKISNNVTIKTIVEKLESLDYAILSPNRTEFIKTNYIPPFYIIKDKFKYHSRRLFQDLLKN